MAKDKEINEGQLNPEIIKPGEDFAEARWNALSQFGIDKPSGNLVRDLESNKKVLLQRGLTIKRAMPAPDMGSGIIQFIASTDGQKRDGNRVRNSGWQFANFAKNPVFLWCHDYRSLPIGKHVDWQVDKEGDGHVLRIWSQFCDPELYAFADKIRKMYEAGFLRAGSIGWNPIKFEVLRDKDGMFMGFDFVENDLLEFSAVPVPSDPDAIVEAISRGIIGERDIEKIQEYGQLPKLSRSVAYTLSNFEPLPPAVMTPEVNVRSSSEEVREESVTEEAEIEEFMNQAFEMIASDIEAMEEPTVDGDTPVEVSPEPESEKASFEEPSVEEPSSGEVEMECSDSEDEDCEYNEDGTKVGGDLEEDDEDDIELEFESDDSEDSSTEEVSVQDKINLTITNAFSEAAAKLTEVISDMLQKHSVDNPTANTEVASQARGKTNFPTRGEDKAVSLSNSNWPQFDRAFAERIKKDYPQIWKSGGNIYGNTAYRLWGEVRSNGGKPSSKEQEKWVRKREAWTARHFEDGRQFKGGKTEPNPSNVAGIVAQIKWGSIGTLGEGKMKDVIRAVMKKIDDKREMSSDNAETRVGKKISNARYDKMMQMRESMTNANDHMGKASNFLDEILSEMLKAEEKLHEDPHAQSPKDKNVYSVDEEYVVAPIVEQPVVQETASETPAEPDPGIEHLARLSSRLSEIEGILAGRSVEVESEDKQEESQLAAEPAMSDFEMRLSRIKETVEAIPAKVKPNTTKPKSEYVQNVLEKIGLLKN
jgi:hypothetical protein